MQHTTYIKKWDYSRWWWYLKRLKDPPTWLKVATTSEIDLWPQSMHFFLNCGNYMNQCWQIVNIIQRSESVKFLSKGFSVQKKKFKTFQNIYKWSPFWSGANVLSNGHKPAFRGYSLMERTHYIYIDINMPDWFQISWQCTHKSHSTPLREYVNRFLTPTYSFTRTTPGYMKIHDIKDKTLSNISKLYCKPGYGIWMIYMKEIWYYVYFWFIMYKQHYICIRLTHGLDCCKLLLYH